MGLEVVIRHTKRQRDLCAQELAAIEVLAANAASALEASRIAVAAAEAACQIPDGELTDANELRHRFATLSRQREQEIAAREHLLEVEQRVADILAKLLGVRQQLRAYERLIERRGGRGE